MTDGLIVPARHDGMAAFPGPDGTTLLVRNHEISPGADPETGAFGADLSLLDRVDRSLLYDAGRSGMPALGGGCGKGGQSPLQVGFRGPHVRMGNVVVGGRQL